MEFTLALEFTFSSQLFYIFFNFHLQYLFFSDRINHVVSLFIHIGLERCEEVQSKWQIVQFVEKAIITELK